jgi:hypothetical protein
MRTSRTWKTAVRARAIAFAMVLVACKANPNYCPDAPHHNCQEAVSGAGLGDARGDADAGATAVHDLASERFARQLDSARGADEAP